MPSASATSSPIGTVIAVWVASAFIGCPLGRAFSPGPSLMISKDTGMMSIPPKNSVTIAAWSLPQVPAAAAAHQSTDDTHGPTEPP
ncbi:hypothetical protein GCM10027079_04660 [Sediminivirga luteola]|uniref:Uncharacterized protein n=1 Tax=Sediminivirga luteola TaxID=1774748 RepID=A0A8J2XK69_9MICO|nr:hypothetical protein GCM10011333_13640 [Sediminivirga luteola]